MSDSKPWYFSKTIWASLIAVAASIGSAFGIDIDDQSREEITNIVLQAVMVAGSIFAIFGRFVANTRID
ncbi:hypothetical protein ACFQ14_05505 [Pseudahrensia aquimaris]|uniref:Holin n=1 Tax=Pseudahrensia aquimaris TaxID=744461 RepID=A0ABW3FBM0_9HYPH